MIDRARGMLLGLAVGDALGAGVEGWSRERILAEVGEVTDYLPGSEINRTRPGQVTDDTDMAMALAESLLEAGGYDEATALKHYLEWFRGDPIGIGNNTAHVLAAADRGEDVRAAAAEYHRRSGGMSAGNGSLMRCAPLAIYFRDDPGAMADAAWRDSTLTHHDEIAAHACVAFTRLLRAALLGEDAPTPLTASAEVAAAAVPDVAEATRRAQGQFAFVLAALQVAVTAARHFGTFVDGLTWAVNLGGDTDTNGAVAGALLGAAHGVRAIPGRWLDALEPRAKVESMAGRLI